MRWCVEVLLSNGCWRAARPSGPSEPYAFASRSDARDFAVAHRLDRVALGGSSGVRLVMVDETGKRAACDHCTAWVSVRVRG